MGDTVIQFKPRDNGDVVKIKPSAKCKHYSFEVDTEARSVNCEQCGDALDPIFVLLRLSEVYSGRDYKYDALQKFEAKEEERRQRDYQRRMAKETKRQQSFAASVKAGD